MQLPKKRTQSIYIIQVFFLAIAGMSIIMLPLSGLRAQCTTTVSQVIPDDGILTIDFHVSGLVDNDLASPTQGVCGVEIDFMHEYLGDLTVSLISPSGTIVQLIGPTTTATTPTNLTRWNIQFIPCASTADPDAGFSAVWSNLQPWQALTPYSGIYHPNSGCLEDFNTGSANGVWQLVFEDHDVLQTGSVASASLIFCNPEGLSCVECDPNGGILSPSSILLCEGEAIHSSGVSIDFGNNNPPPELYSYTYLLHSGNTIVHSGSPFTFNPPPGTYSLCGLSYLTIDSALTNSLLAGGDYNQLIQAIANQEICASLSSSCISVDIVPIPDTIVTDVLLCNGDSYVFKGQLYTTPGLFTVVVDGIGQCDSVFILNITQSDLLAAIATPDSITCGSGGVLLNGSLSQGGVGPIAYEWSTVTGIINGNLMNSQVTALIPGIYSLTVQDGVCEDIKNVEVIGDMSYPQIFVIADAITCAEPVANIRPVVVPSNVTYSWTGPGGFASSVKNIDVTVPGRYFLRVVSPAGCEALTYVDILSNISPPDATISLFDKACSIGLGVLGTSTTNSIYEWSGPESGLPASQVIQVASAGTYMLTVTDPATGCSGTSSYFFDADFNVPAINVSGIDSIRCNQDVALFISPSDIAGQPYWSGPNGFITFGFNVILSQPGTYGIYVVGNNGCRNSQSIELFSSSNYPDYQITNDTITCNNILATIGITIADADLYNWIELSSPESQNAFVQVTTPGTYTVIATDTNSGCEIKAIANVISDQVPPLFNYQTDTLSCAQPIGTLELLPVPGQIYMEVQWQYPDMTIVTNPSIPVNEPGDYLLTVTGVNGCIGSSLVTVETDTVLPVFFLEPDILGCDRQGMIHNIRVDSLMGIFWTGPNGFTSSEFEPVVSDTGTYTAAAFTSNGCPKEVTAYVSGDFEPPVSLLSLETLTCLTPFAEFIAHSNDSIISYEWRDDSSNVIGTDSIVVVTTPGIYTLTLEGYNHCFSVDSIVLAPADYPSIAVTTDTLKCNIDSVLIVAGSDAADPEFAWLNENGDTLSRVEELHIDYAGPFIISVTASNGCEVKDTLTIPVDTANAIAILNLIGEVRCQNRDFVLDGSESLPANIEFQWGTIGGMILSADTIPAINASDTGIYFLSVTNTSNGCTSSDTIHVMDHPDAITLAYIDIKRPECSGDANASISISGLEGGVGAILFQLDSLPPQSTNSFQGLTAGDFLLQISDTAGCRYDTLINIEPTNPYTVDAGPDQEIFIGESADLTGITDIMPDEVFSQDWDSMGVLLCQDCPSSHVTPWTSTTFRFTVESITGCLIEDEMVVYVIEKGKFFIPNIFSPNGDNINDELSFYPSPGIARVLNWVIYDRWGNAVFGKSNFTPGDPLAYWDGTGQGSENLNPGVYPYIAEIELINGNKETHHGSITLIR